MTKQAFLDFVVRYIWTIISLIITITAFARNKYFLGVVFLLVTTTALWFAIKKQNNEKNALRIMHELKEFMDEIKQEGALLPIENDLMLSDAEEAYYESDAILYETQAIRRSTGGGGGFRVAKGVYVGGYKGSSESKQEWRQQDHGILTVTGKKLIFHGDKLNRSYPLKKILSIENTLMELHITVEGRAKKMLFEVPNAYEWSVALQLIKNHDPKSVSAEVVDGLRVGK